MIYLTGDTHGEINLKKLSNKNFLEGKSLSKNDYVIILGDFGLLWRKDETFEYWLKFLNERNFKILFVDGNHENFNLINEYPIEIWNGGKIHKISDNIYHLMRGQIFTIDNLKFFTFGGASSIDILERKENIDWWKEELPSYSELNEGLINLQNHNFKVDYILSHTCSQSTINEIYNINKDYVLENCTKETQFEFKRFTSSHYSNIDILNRYFDEIKKITAYTHWYFGHFHMDLPINNKETIVYNDFIKIK